MADDPGAVEDASPTCSALNLGKSCCLTFTFFFCPFILVQFGLIKYHPAFAIPSVLLLPPTVFFLMWLMALEFLMCVVGWFIGVTIQLFVTIGYLIRRRIEHGPAWLSKTAQDNDTAGADMVGDALDSLNGRIKMARDLSGLSWGDEGGSRRRSRSPSSRRRSGDSSPESLRRSGSMLASPREGIGTRLRDALGERMGELASAAGQAVEARREARGEVPLDPENDPATWSDARLASYLRGFSGTSSAALQHAPRPELVRRAYVAMGLKPPESPVALRPPRSISPRSRSGAGPGAEADGALAEGGAAGCSSNAAAPVIGRRVEPQGGAAAGGGGGGGDGGGGAEGGGGGGGAARPRCADLDLGSAQDEEDIELFRHLSSPERRRPATAPHGGAVREARGAREWPSPPRRSGEACQPQP